MQWQRWLGTAILLPLILTLSGCLGGSTSTSGPQGAQVKGTLNWNGQGYKPQQDEVLALSFVHNEEETSCDAEVDLQAGTFEVIQPLPAGRYRIVVTSTTEEGTEGDRFREAFSEENSPLEYEVTDAADQSIVVDLGKKVVSRR